MPQTDEPDDNASARPGPDAILPTYERVCERFARERDRSLFEAPWLERALAGRASAQVLDLGCGSGQPIAAFFVDRGCEVTGVDGAPGMIAIFRRNLPESTAIVADMRSLDLGQKFDVVIAWNSFFHLDIAGQWAAMEVFGRHCRPGGHLLFTSGPDRSEVWGVAGGAPVYHASASRPEYRERLAHHGFEVVELVVEDEDCRGQTIWLVQKQHGAAGRSSS